MKQIRIWTSVIALLFATGAFAQSGNSNDSGGQGSGQNPAANPEMPTVAVQLKLLTEKLALTGEQPAKVKAILQDLHEATQKLVQDGSITSEERLNRVRPLREKADQRIRNILTGDQKQKLDQLEQGPHPELHGDLHGAIQRPSHPPML